VNTKQDHQLLLLNRQVSLLESQMVTAASQHAEILDKLAIVLASVGGADTP